MEIVLESLRADWLALQSFAPRLLYAAIVLVGFILLSVLIDRSVTRVFAKWTKFSQNRRMLSLLTRALVMSIGVLVALGVLGWHGVVASLLAAGGVVAVVLGFAFREIGENLLAGLFLTFSRPFNIGDLVKTGDLTGVVESIEWRHIHLRTFDACDVYVPSAQIFREALYNYTRDGLRRPSFTIGIDYAFEPQEVIDLLLGAVKSTQDVLTHPVPFVSIKSFAAQVIEYEVFFFMDISQSERGLIAARNDVKIRCREALNEAEVVFSTDVPTGVEVLSLPPLNVELSQRSN